MIWASAAEDAGDDGPFRSVIYRAATISPENRQHPIAAIPNNRPSWIIDGFKVESLAGPAPEIEGSVMSFATEDENYTGQWRPLFHPAQ